MSNLKKLLIGESTYVKVEDKNRFYYMLQQMQSNRWKITSIVLFLFFFIIAGINSAVFFGVSIEENWKEMLLILLGAFVGNLNKVVDYWFNSEDRDKMLIQKVDEEDGNSLSSVTEYPTTPRSPQGPVVVVNHVKEEAPSADSVVAAEETPVNQEPLTYDEPSDYGDPGVYTNPTPEEYPTEETPQEDPEENK
jgi:uncharacterized membrane protein (DUF485 family)